MHFLGSRLSDVATAERIDSCAETQLGSVQRHLLPVRDDAALQEPRPIGEKILLT
jgi:hypothetical protein